MIREKDPYEKEETFWTWITSLLLTVIVIGACVGVVRAALTQQVPPPAPASQMAYLKKQADQPQAFVLKRAVTDGVICAERYDSDYVDCRPVDEFRKWVRERPAVKR